MIVLKAKAESSSASPINLSTPDEKSSGKSSSLSFGELLRGEGVKIKGSVVLALDDKEVVLPILAQTKEVSEPKDSKSSGLIALLKGDAAILGEEIEALELNPKITQNMSVKEIKTLINDAKSYLKDQIINSDGYKQSQIKELPQTLKGLAQLAKKFDIDISKITLEEVKSSASDIDVDKKVTKAKYTTKSDDILDVKVEQRVDKKATKISNSTQSIDLKVDKKIAEISKGTQSIDLKVVEQKVDKKTAEISKGTQSIDLKEVEQKVDKKTIETSKNTQSIDLDEVEQKVDKKTTKIPKSTQNVDLNEEIQKDIKKEVQKDIKADIRINEGIKVNNTSTIKEMQTPIFKVQSAVEIATTEQVVQAKQFKIQPAKTPKDKADETLKLLLRGEKPSSSGVNMTADFSVATAKVIAPRATTDASRSFEALLRGDSSGQATDVKAEPLTTHKADSFEVKLNEAKQMVKYISTDVKQAIDDYKSPFTRIKVQLNPQKLGEVELTVVQRGKNLHVNISSNNVAVNALAMNLNELKTQLSNNGINNASFNFNSGSENGSSSNEQQKNSQQEQQNADEEYNYFETEGQNEEILSSLEIVVPSYA